MNSSWIRFLFCLASLCSVGLVAPGVQAQETVMLPPDTSPQVMQGYNEAVKLLMAHQAAKAVDRFATVMPSLQSVPEALCTYGMALVNSGKVDQAVVELEKARKLKPNAPLVLMNLGMAYQTQGRSAEALPLFQKYMQLYPNGTYAKHIGGIVNMLKTESSRTEGVENSKGKPHYLSEAIAIGALRWNVEAMPVVIYIADGKGLKGYTEELGEALRQAFDEWVAASDGKITVKYTNDPAVARIDCRWTESAKDLVNPAEGGQALVAPDAKGHINQVKMKLLTMMPNNSGPVSATALKHVALHEIGHSLGLMGHSSQPEDIMFASINFEVPHPVLTDRDKMTLVELYSAPESLLAEKRLNSQKGGLVGESGPLAEVRKLTRNGIDLLNAKRYLAAIACFEKARTLAPDMDFTLNNLAVAYANLGNEEARNKDYVHSQEHLQQAANLYKKLHMRDMEKQAYEVLVTVARLRGNQADATKFQNAAKALGSKSP